MSSSGRDSSDSGHSDTDEKFSDATDLPPEGMPDDTTEDIPDVPTELTRGEENTTERAQTQKKTIPETERDATDDTKAAREFGKRLKVKHKTFNLAEIKHKFGPLEDKKCHLCKYFYSIGNETLIVHAQEPWPKDVKFFQPYEIEQILLPDNANCLAVQAFLKMCNLDYQIESRPNAEYMSPSGKVPFIKCGAFVVSELEGIVAFVAQKGISLTDHLEPEQKSDLRAYMSLIDHVLGNAEAYVCWCDSETYRDVTKPRNGSVYPWPLNLIQTWIKRSKETKRLKTLGWLEKTLEEVFQEVETCCQALTDRLEKNTYFFGNKFTELDALTYGHIYTILTTRLPAGENELAFVVSKFKKLLQHCKKLDKELMARGSDFTVERWPKQCKKLQSKTMQKTEVKQEQTDSTELTDRTTVSGGFSEPDVLEIELPVDQNNEDISDGLSQGDA